MIMGRATIAAIMGTPVAAMAITGDASAVTVNANNIPQKVVLRRKQSGTQLSVCPALLFYAIYVSLRQPHRHACPPQDFCAQSFPQQVSASSQST